MLLLKIIKQQQVLLLFSLEKKRITLFILRAVAIVGFKKCWKPEFERATCISIFRIRYRAEYSNCLFLILFLLIIPDYGVGRNSLSEAEINRFCNQFS